MEERLKLAENECQFWKEKYEAARRIEMNELQESFASEVGRRLAGITKTLEGFVSFSSLECIRPPEFSVYTPSDVLNSISQMETIVSVIRDGNKPKPEMRISLSSFKVNDIALFFPTPRGDYLAFHVGCPHYYLSEESKALIGTVIQ